MDEEERDALRASLRAQREAEGKSVGWDCDAWDCYRNVSDGPLWRVNPFGQPGIFMCAEHASFVNTWETRLT